MPRVTRQRSIAAPVEDVWRLVSDPHSLPRWWPRLGRVENVDQRAGGRRSQWTKVFLTSEGRGVRADYRCVSATANERYAWEQDLAGTPFAKHLRRSRVEIALRPEGGGARVAITSAQALRGMSKLGAPLMRRGQRRIVDEALDGIERALT